LAAARAGVAKASASNAHPSLFPALTVGAVLSSYSTMNLAEGEMDCLETLSFTLTMT